jgi:hypothetical protein
VAQIHGNIYLGRVQNVLPGMEAAFVDIGTPKNAVLYRGDVQIDKDDLEGGGGKPKIEQMLKARQTLICQVSKNPIKHKVFELEGQAPPAPPERLRCASGQARWVTAAASGARGCRTPGPGSTAPRRGAAGSTSPSA